MILFVSILLIISVLYILLIFFLSWGWKKLATIKREKTPLKTKVSVIVPFRNEEANIPCLIRDLDQQDYPKQNFEVILVNDHSTDKSPEIIEKLTIKKDQFILVQNRGHGKKNAVLEGVRNSSGKLIVTTDADCRINSTCWLCSIISLYELKKPKMIVAPVLVKNNSSIFQKLQALEFLSLTGASAGAIGINKPIMCNGANLAFEKEEFEKVKYDLKTNLASGEDIFLLHSIKRKTKSQILFLKSPDAIIKTHGQRSLKSFLNQRKRWTSKIRFYSDRDSLGIALLVFFTNLSLLITFFGSFMNLKLFWLFMALFILKSIPDFIFLRSLTSFFRIRKLLFVFLPLQFLYFFYVSLTGIYGNLGKYMWKGRKVK
jgi:cellulose synthase/poly-beta-1,6-N-acetylglucosamine synthase-like glycosyltransferase